MFSTIVKKSLSYFNTAKYLSENVIDIETSGVNETIGVDLSSIDDVDVATHSRYRRELEANQQGLLMEDQRLVNLINETHAKLTSNRVALRAVETALTTIYNTELRPSIIYSIDEIRANAQRKEEALNFNEAKKSLNSAAEEELTRFIADNIVDNLEITAE